MGVEGRHCQIMRASLFFVCIYIHSNSRGNVKVSISIWFQIFGKLNQRQDSTFHEAHVIFIYYYPASCKPFRLLPLHTEKCLVATFSSLSFALPLNWGGLQGLFLRVHLLLTMPTKFSFALSYLAPIMYLWWALGPWRSQKSKGWSFQLHRAVLNTFVSFMSKMRYEN